jgi:hypothetical protein
MTAPLTYKHRPKPFGQEAIFVLGADRMKVRHGRRKAEFVYRDVAMLRLTYAPTNIASDGYRGKLITRTGRSVGFTNLSWRSMAEMERHHDAYRAFVAALAEQVAHANPDATFSAGLAPWRFRTMCGLAGATGAALAGAALFALYQRLQPSAAWPAGLASLLAGMAGFTLVYLVYWMRRYLGRNRPASFQPGAIPERVLPKASA